MRTREPWYASQHERVAAVDEATRYVAACQTRRHRRRVAIAGACALTVLVAGAVVYLIGV